MRTFFRPAALLLLLAPACGYDIGADGRIVGADGRARSGVSVQLQALDYGSGSVNALDSLASPVKESVATDEAGQFSLRHNTGGGFGCGVADAPVVTVAPDGPNGAAVVARLASSEANRIAQLGELRLPAAITADVVDGDLYLGVDHAAGAYVDVDGQTWQLDERAVLPAAALAACPSASPCEHRLRAQWSEGQTRLFAPQLAVSTVGPEPRWHGELAAGAEVWIDAPVQSAVLYLDGDIPQDALFGPAEVPSGATPPEVAMTSVAGAPDYELLPANACTRYGTGQRCVLPDGHLYALRAATNGSPVQARILSR